jgi:hypothetical protein
MGALHFGSECRGSFLPLSLSLSFFPLDCTKLISSPSLSAKLSGNLGIHFSLLSLSPFSLFSEPLSLSLSPSPLPPVHTYYAPLSPFKKTCQCGNELPGPPFLHVVLVLSCPLTKCIQLARGRTKAHTYGYQGIGLKSREKDIPAFFLFSQSQLTVLPAA